MTVWHYIDLRDSLKMNRTFKFLSFLVLLVMPFFIQAQGQCVELFYVNPTDGVGRPYYAVYTDVTVSADDCYTLESSLVIVNPAEFAVFNEKVKQTLGFEQITATNVMSAFTFGFGTYATFWFLGFKGRTARRAIKEV